MTESRNRPASLLDADVAAWLTAAALNQLDGGEGADDDGCCPECCAPCKALRRLDESGQLDDVVRGFAAGEGWYWWDEDAGRVDRGWLTRSWRLTGCHDTEGPGVSGDPDGQAC